MTRRQSQKNTTKLVENIVEEEVKSEAPAEEEAPVAEEAPAVEDSAKAPANVEIEASEEPLRAPEAPAPEKLQTDFREKLAKKDDSQNPFVPSTPASLEKAASEVAQEKGFDLNRGTSIGARLLARARSNK